MTIRIGSLFSGIGALDFAAQACFDGRVVWHCEADSYCARVLERRWPDVPWYPDVRQLEGRVLEPVDVLVGGFPCTDLSTAGKGAGLTGKHSGLYFEMLRLVGELKPQHVVIENVQKLFFTYQPLLDEHFAALGYGLAWMYTSAANVGAGHWRRRVFVVGERGAAPRGQMMKPVGRDFTTWPGYNGGGRSWPTPTAGDAKASGSRSLSSSKAHAGTSLTDAVRVDRTVSGVRPWSTPTVAMATNGDCPSERRRRSPGLHAQAAMAQEVRPWPTPNARDQRSGKGGAEAPFNRRRVGSLQLTEVVGGCLNPAWVEHLMGLPEGWTDLDVPTQAMVVLPEWPAWGGEEQRPWEPPRLVAPRSLVHRRARLKALGNAVVPEAAADAISRALS
ncbi:MAG: DNA cytosine methyltransferase [Pseudomonadota bacterium]